MGHFAVIVFLSISLVSCAMGPDYSRPELDVPQSFRMAETNGESIANLLWWELFTDNELQRLIRIALRENKDLKLAVGRIEEFRARAYVARTDFIPQLSATINDPWVQRGGARIPGFPTPFTHTLQGELAWEIDIWGRIRRSNEAALDDLFASEENQRAVILGLVTESPSLISISFNLICNWRFRNAHSAPGKSRCRLLKTDLSRDWIPN